MNGDSLFEVPVSLSPKLQWLRNHGLTTLRTENGKWICVLNEDNQGRGATEEDACADFCVKHKLPHWNTP